MKMIKKKITIVTQFFSLHLIEFYNYKDKAKRPWIDYQKS
jgi:hypothetical protein